MADPAPAPAPQGGWYRLWNSSKAWTTLGAALAIWFAPYAPDATPSTKAQSEQTRLYAIAGVVIANLTATGIEDHGK